MNRLPRVLAFHDLTGVGRCALTLVMPVMSAAGVQVCPVPTALLSTHPGGFGTHTLFDTTSVMEAELDHYNRLDLAFEGIYSGFLGDVGQVEVMKEVIKCFGRDDMVITVDPVFGDKGELYQTMVPEMVEKMRELIAYANVITPNMTEAAFLLQKPVGTAITVDEARAWAKELAVLTRGICVITGLRVINRFNEVGTCAYDPQTDIYYYESTPHLKEPYHGTGDIFASVLTALLMQKQPLEVALKKAVSFVSAGIRYAAEHQMPICEGIPVEAILDLLTEKNGGGLTCTFQTACK